MPEVIPAITAQENCTRALVQVKSHHITGKRRFPSGFPGLECATSGENHEILVWCIEREYLRFM